MEQELTKKHRVQRETLIFCPKCNKHRKPSEFTLVEPGLKWTRVKCLHCGNIFGIFGAKFRRIFNVKFTPAKRIVEERGK